MPLNGGKPNQSWWLFPDRELTWRILPRTMCLPDVHGSANEEAICFDFFEPHSWSYCDGKAPFHPNPAWHVTRRPERVDECWWDVRGFYGGSLITRRLILNVFFLLVFRLWSNFNRHTFIWHKIHLSNSRIFRLCTDKLIMTTYHSCCKGCVLVLVQYFFAAAKHVLL